MVLRAQAAVSILSALLLLYICLQSSLATSTAATDLSDAPISHDGRQLQQVDGFYGLQQHVSKPHTRRSAINIKKDRKDALPKQPQHPKQQDEQQQQQQQLDVPPVQHREQQHILEEPLEHQQQVQEHPHPHQQHQQEQQQLQVEEIEQPQPRQQEQQQRQEEKEEVDIISKQLHHQLLPREEQDPADSQQKQHMPGQQQQQQQQQQPALSKSQQLELNPDPELPKPRWVQPGDDSKPSHPDENGNSDGDTHSAGAGGDDDAVDADSTNSAKAPKWLLEPGSGEQHASPDRSSSSSSTVDPTKASNPAVGADGTEHVKAPKWQVQPGVAGEDSSLVTDSSPGVAEAESGSFTPPKWVTDTYADAGATEDSQQQQDPALKLEGAEDAVEEAEDALEEDEALYPEDYEPGALASKTPRHLRRRKHAKAHLKPHHETPNPSYSVLPGKPAHQQYEALKEYPYKAVEDYLSNQYDLDIIEDNYQHHQKHTAQQKQVNPRQGEAPHQQQQQQYNMPQVPHEGNLRHTWHEVHDQLQQEQQHQQYSSGYDHADHPPKQHHKSSQDQHQLQRPYQQQKQRAEYEPSPGQQLPPLYADSGSSLDEEDSHAWEERRYELQKRLKLRHEQYKRAQQGRKQQPKQQQPEQQQQQGPVGGDEEQHQHSRGSYKDEMQQYLEPHHQQQQQQPEQQQEPHHHHQQQQQQQQQSKRSWRDELREESEEADYKDDNEPWFKSKTDASFVGGKPGQHQQQQASGDPLKGLLPEDPLESLVPKDPLEQLLQPPGTDTYYRDSDKEETIPDALQDLKNQLISGPTENQQQQQQQKVTTPGLRKERPTIPPSKQQQQQQQGPSDLTGNFITDKLNKGLLADGNQHQQQHDPLKELMQVPEQQQQQQQQQTSDSLEDLKDQLLTPDPQKQQQQQQLPLHKDFTPGDSSGGFWGNGAATGSSRKQQPQAHSITPGDSSGGFWGDGPAKGNKQQQQQKQGHGFGNNSPVPRQQLGPSKNIFSGGSSQLPKWASDTLAPELQPRFDFFGGGSAKPIKGIFGGGSGKPIKAKHSRPLPNDRDTDEHGSEPADDQFNWGPEEQQDWTQERLPERDERKSREETHVHPRDQRDQRPKLVGEDQEEWFQRSVPEPEQAVEDEPETRERIQNAGEQPSVPKWAQPLPTDALLSVDHTDSPRQQQQQQQQQQQLPLPLPQQPSVATPVAESEIEAAFPACSDSQQILQCGQLPVETAAEQETHRMCCRMFAPRRIPSELLPPPVERVECERWDLEDDGPLAQPLEWFWEQQQGACTAKATAAVPTFAADRVSLVGAL
jgi:hypothetical protein